MIKVEKIYRRSSSDLDSKDVVYSLWLINEEVREGFFTISLTYVNANDADEYGEICDVSYWQIDISCQPFALKFLAQTETQSALRWMEDFCSTSSRFATCEDFEAQLVKVFGCPLQEGL